MSFSDLGLEPGLVRAVAEKGYATPTPIQRAAIPAVLAGRDVLAGAQTGTGKTAAFVLPILQRLHEPQGCAPRALVLTPTRELAAQVAESAGDYGRHSALRTAVIFGGVSEKPQIEALRAGCDLLIATPGRLLDLAGQRVLDLGAVRCCVLDEADRMLDMGFIHDIRRILKLLPRERQNLMFSATYSHDIRGLAAGLLREPLTIEVAPRNATAERIAQQVYRVPQAHKRHLLTHLIEHGQWQQVLVFTRTKHAANRLTQQLQAAGISAAAIHGNKSQNARTRALSEFRENRIIALIATEVAARGLDIRELPHVVNFELPHVPEDYVHRIGRTARAGNSGAAISLVSPDEAPLLRDIEKLLGHPLATAQLPHYPLPAAPSGVIAGQTPGAGVATPSPRSAPRHETRRPPGRHAQRPARARPHHGHGRAASEKAGNPRARGAR
ncbi:MAG TPA: DEAD/DEAH box helicase [Steroidobacteraceae bacterium]